MAARAATPSSSAAATTAWSPPPISPRPACARSSSRRATASAARSTRASSRRAPASRRSPTRSAGCDRPSSATSSSSATASSCRPGRPGLRAPARRAVVALWRDEAATVAALAPVGGRWRGLSRLRPRGPGAGPFPGGPRRRDPARRPPARVRRCAAGPPPRSHVPEPRPSGRPDDPARAADGRRRLRGRVVRERPVRATIAWRGVRHTAMGPWSAGPPRSCSTTRPAATAARPARRSSPAAARARWPTRWPRPHARRAPRSAPTPMSSPSRPSRRPRHGRGARVAARRSRPRPSSLASTPSGPLTTLVDPVTLGPTLRWRAGNLRTAGRSSPRSTSSSPACPTFRPRPTTTRACCVAGSSWRPASTPSSGPSTPRKYGRPPSRRRRGDHPVARRSEPRRRARPRRPRS